MNQRHQHDDAPSNVPSKERATLVTTHLSAEEFALHETFSAVPDLTLECTQLVASGEQTVLPLLWMTTDDHSALRSALAADPSVNAAEELLEADGRRLYRLDWSDDVRLIFRVILDAETVLLGGFGAENRWTFELLFPTREALGRVCDRCQLYEVDYSIDRIRGFDNHNGDDTPRSTRIGLTPEQYEAIATAYKHGYFTVPREITLDELAASLGISHQALSERLRRAHDTLVGECLRNPCLGFGLTPNATTTPSKSEFDRDSTSDRSRTDSTVSDLS